MKLKPVTLLAWIGFTVLGGLIALAGSIAIYYLQRPSDDQIKREVAIDHAAYAQKAMGMQCSEVGASLRSLLKQKVDPIIRGRKYGEAWHSLVSANLRNELKRHDEFVLTCARLYVTGEAGQLNQLQGIGYLEKAQQDVSLVSTLLIYAQGSEEICNKKCLNSKFDLLARSYSRLMGILEENRAIGSNSAFDADAFRHRST